MKLTLSLLFLFIPLVTWAEAECYVKAGYTIPVSSGFLKDHDLENAESKDMAANWEGCFLKALALCRKMDSKMDLPESMDTGLIYCEWEFNDGVINDSDGKVTKFTKIYAPEPQKGDRRFYSNGLPYVQSENRAD